MSEKLVQVICRNCETNQTDVVWGTHVQWVICRKCKENPRWFWTWWDHIDAWFRKLFQARKEGEGE